MRLTINGESEQHDCNTLTVLLDSLGHQPECVATAVNGEFVSITERDVHLLTENDVIEIIAPMAGG